MKVSINGQPREVTAGNLAELVGGLGLAAERVALERNYEIVPRSHWEQTAIADGDRFEIVHFVGGG